MSTTEEINETTVSIEEQEPVVLTDAAEPVAVEHPQEAVQPDDEAAVTVAEGLHETQEEAPPVQGEEAPSPQMENEAAMEQENVETMTAVVEVANDESAEMAEPAVAAQPMATEPAVTVAAQPMAAEPAVAVAAQPMAAEPAVATEPMAVETEAAVETVTTTETTAGEPMPVGTAVVESVAVEAANAVVEAAAASAAMETAETPQLLPAVIDTNTFGEGIDEPAEYDVLNGRGANINSHKGNQQFRSLCFQRKPEFDAGNHAVKRRIATEIVGIMTTSYQSRFLKKRTKQGPWYELTKEKSILKACQVMRDFQRPDRAVLRETALANARKRNRTKPPSTPLPDTPIPTTPLEPIVENPFGVHDHDVLSGRGAFVNGHVGNSRFRKLALERKTQFDNGNYSEKRALATEIVGIIRSLDPPGRFLKRVNKQQWTTRPEEPSEEEMPTRGLDDSWEELTDDKAIHKACQVMRDIDRPDRGPEHKRIKKEEKEKLNKALREAAASGNLVATMQQVEAEQQQQTEQVVAQEPHVEDVGAAPEEQAKDSITMLAETTAAEATAVQDAVAAAEAALDTVMDGVQNVPPPATTEAPPIISTEETVAESIEVTATETADTGEEEPAGGPQEVAI